MNKSSNINSIGLQWDGTNLNAYIDTTNLGSIVLNSNLGTIYSTFLIGKNEINNWTKISGRLTIPSGVYIIHAKLCGDANNPLSNMDILANDNTIARCRYQTQVTTFYEFTEETTIEVKVHNPSQINYTQSINNYLQAIRIK